VRKLAYDKAGLADVVQVRFAESEFLHRRVELHIGDVIPEIFRLHVLLCRRARLPKKQRENQIEPEQELGATNLRALRVEQTVAVIALLDRKVMCRRTSLHQEEVWRSGQAQRRLRDVAILFGQFSEARTKRSQVFSDTNRLTFCSGNEINWRVRDAV
jgi:hypothetical protein